MKYIKTLNESAVNEKVKGWNDVAKVMDKALKKAKVSLSYAKEYVQSLERMAKRDSKQFFADYGDFTESDFIEDVEYNMANESKDFEPHMMYDPETGKEYKAEKPEDHERMTKLGYVHEKPESVDENYKTKAGFVAIYKVMGQEFKFGPLKTDDKKSIMAMLSKAIQGGFQLIRVVPADQVKESIITEAKKFKPGDKWSNDFDYEGMLKYALKTSIKTPIKTLNKLFDSATDVNYHTPFRNLGIAIDWIEDGDKEGAKDYMDSFIEDIKKEIKG